MKSLRASASKLITIDLNISEECCAALLRFFYIKNYIFRINKYINVRQMYYEKAKNIIKFLQFKGDNENEETN